MIARLLGVLLLGVSIVTHAAALPITGGSATIGTSNFGHISIVGPDFALDAQIIDSPVFVCQSCLPVPQTLNSSISAPSDLWLPGSTIVLDGTTYGPPFLSGLLLFDGTWTPPIPGPPIVDVTAPFTFTGSLTPSLTSGTVDLTGYGTATIHLTDLTFSGVYFRQSIEYEFIPVPEPTTGLLLGSSLFAWLGAHLYRSRRRWEPAVPYWAADPGPQP
jgi:hypothetical protein